MPAYSEGLMSSCPSRLPNATPMRVQGIACATLIELRQLIAGAANGVNARCGRHALLSVS